MQDRFVFPREEKNRLGKNVQIKTEYMDESKIKNTVETALKDVLLQCDMLGLPYSYESWSEIQIKFQDSKQLEEQLEMNEEELPIVEISTEVNIYEKEVLSNEAHMYEMRDEVVQEDETSDETLDEKDLELNDETEDETDFCEEFGEQMVEDDNKALPEIEIRKFYATFYDNKWYIGKVLKVIKENVYSMQFLEESKEDGSFNWHKASDLDENVSKEYIFFGPINFIGNTPYTLKRSVKASITKQYNKQRFL
ncbi:unnamed protein product [Brassicogethes aeneus]|uniref:Tudor domain-containing protein n=1 Tax=Brassicogethes aeneus TaxID=1431903 RepID=A0A9P0BJA6_BRAAE|nr:unnamed protein product [Brassicogethes aeneus]